MSFLGPRDRQCSGKKAFLTKARAKLFLRRAPKVDPEFRRDDLGIYRCPHCGAFHIGHKKGR